MLCTWRMRLRNLFSLLLFGSAGLLAVQNRRRAALRPANIPRPVEGESIFDEPDAWDARMDISERESLGRNVDPAQGFEVVPLTATDLEIASDLARVDDLADLPTDEPVGDVGELYGVHVIPATDTDIPDNDKSYDVGENWIESLETTSAENGPEAEHELDIIDTQDAPPHPSDTRDTPVADFGSAGPRGV